MPNAYDYEQQEWKTGREAVALLRHQARESLELLRSTTGAKYAALLGINRTSAIHATRRFLADLENAN